MRHIRTLFHLAEAANLTSILQHGLMSTERLVDSLKTTAEARRELLVRHRTDCVQISETILIRDQKPMPPSALARALDDGLQPADWFGLLNGFVFFWPDKERMLRQLGACGGRPQVLLTFDTDSLVKDFGDFAFVSPINSGNARRRPARRGLTTFLPYRTWIDAGWPNGARWRSPAEVVFKHDIPVLTPYLLEISEPVTVL